MWMFCRAQNQEAEGNKPVRYMGISIKTNQIGFFYYTSMIFQ